MLRPREIVRARGVRRSPTTLPEIARLQLPVTHDRRLELRARGGPPRRCSISCKTHGLEGFGLDGHVAAVQAAGGLVAYLRDTQKVDLAHVRAISYKTVGRLPHHRSDHAEASRGRRRQRRHGRRDRCCNEIDRTVTSMGGRLLRAWLLRPLVSLERIRDRLDAVEELAFRADRSRPVPRDAEDGPGPRAARRARRARHRRPARSRRAAAVARRGPPDQTGARTRCRRRCSAASLAELDDLPTSAI